MSPATRGPYARGPRGGVIPPGTAQSPGAEHSPRRSRTSSTFTGPYRTKRLRGQIRPPYISTLKENNMLSRRSFLATLQIRLHAYTDWDSTGPLYLDFETINAGEIPGGIEELTLRVSEITLSAHGIPRFGTTLTSFASPGPEKIEAFSRP